jgi:hypothetical protein
VFASTTTPAAATNGTDGFVSLEVSPLLAYDSARRLHRQKTIRSGELREPVQTAARLLSLLVNFLRNFVTFGATTTWQ